MEHKITPKLDADFAEIESKLSDTASRLFGQIAELHIYKPYGAVSIFYLDIQETNEGSYHILKWAGAGARSGDKFRSDAYDLSELVVNGLLIEAGTQNDPAYLISSKGIQFYKWGIQQAGSEPILQVERTICSIIEESQQLSTRHSKTKQHLRSALDKVWSSELNDSIIHDIGSSLRSALLEITADLLEYEANPTAIEDPEKVSEALAPWLEQQSELSSRQATLLKSQIAAAASSCNRLYHVRDEKSKGRATPNSSEVRRTIFAVVLCCYELNSLS